MTTGTTYRSPDGRGWSLVGEATHTETGQTLVVLREEATGRLTCGSLAWFAGAVTALPAKGELPGPAAPRFEAAANGGAPAGEVAAGAAPPEKVAGGRAAPAEDWPEGKPRWLLMGEKPE